MRYMDKIKNKAGIILIACLTLIPLFFWLSLATLSARFGSLVSALTSIGQISALIGTVLFSVNLFLAGRFKFSESFFGGLNKIYINHHAIGSLAFILLLVHPLVLTIKYLPISTKLAAIFLLPSIDDPAKSYGIFSLILMIVLLILTYFLRPRYQVWKITHKFLGGALFFAGLHSYFIPSDISRSIGLRIYMLSIIAIGLYCAFYKLFLINFFTEKTYSVKRINKLNNDIIEIELAPSREKLKYNPGQFIFIRFIDKNITDESHPFSLTSVPTDNNLKLAIKSLGDFTSNLKKISVDTMVKIKGPYGKFYFKNYTGKNQVWIAGGIGLTPFLGMARSLKNEKDGYNIDLYYSVNQQNEAVYLDELKTIARAVNGFRILPFFSNEQGRITAQTIAAGSGDLKNKEILLCGPAPMMRGLREQLSKLGINNKKIHSEDFGF
jgi:predicted ferric reductase